MKRYLSKKFKEIQMFFQAKEQCLDHYEKKEWQERHRNV